MKGTVSYFEPDTPVLHGFSIMFGANVSETSEHMAIHGGQKLLKPLPTNSPHPSSLPSDCVTFPFLHAASCYEALICRNELLMGHTLINTTGFPGSYHPANIRPDPISG